MYGWRARIGKISPSRSDTFTYEFYKIVPEGVVLVLTGFGIYNLVSEELDDSYLRLENSAKDLAKVGVDFIIAGGGPPVFARKEGGKDQDAIRRIEELTKIPTTTSLTADIEALRKLSVKKVVVATPYVEERNQILKEYLEMIGFEVLNIKGLGIQVNADIAKVPTYEVYRHAKAAFLATPDAEGIFIPCARWPTIGNIDKLETDLEVPVVTSTTAQIWKAFDCLRIREPIKGYGKLLQMK